MNDLETLPNNGYENKGTIEKSENRIDSEFDDLESEFSLQERIGLTNQLVREVINPPLYAEHVENNRRNMVASPESDIDHFLLPGIPDEEGEKQEVRESYDNRAEYLKTEERLFLRVGQGEMWILPKTEEPYFQISMSECSTIVGVKDNNFIVAHISFSKEDEVDTTLDFMREKNVKPENIYVFPSVGKYQKEQSKELDENRVLDTSRYVNQGIPNNNISSFEFWRERGESKEGWIDKNMAQIIGCKDALFRYSYDLRIKSNKYFRSEELDGEYINEEIIDL